MYNTPILIVNRDRLTSTRKLCEDFMKKGYNNLFIIDMKSTYPPLIEWYATNEVPVIYMENVGQQALWNTDLMKRFSDYPFVVYTDSDIELNPATPDNFIEQMILIAQDFRINKVGCAIKIDDLLDNELCTLIRKIESNYWVKKIQYGKLELFDSPLDTTLCVVRTNLPFSYQAVRIGGDYTVRHLPWYENWDNLTEEEEYFMEHADPKFSTLKGHYMKWKEGRPITL